MFAWFQRIEKWVTDRLWAEDLRAAPQLRRLIISAARVLVYAVRSFRVNVVGIQAAGLTMFTVLGLFPLLWLAFFVAKMLGFADRLMEELHAFFKSEIPASLQEAVATLEDLVEHANRQDLELWGVFLLVYAGYALFNKVEEAFNHVWKAHRRSWYKRLGSFVGLVFIVPVLILAAAVAESFLPEIWLIEFGMQWVPLFVLWVALTLLYKAMPSATVRWTAAAIAGAVAALLAAGLHVFYIKAQFGVAQYNALYAALAVIPMLLIYIELLWTVTLAGVQITYAIQNIHSLGPPQEVPPATHRLRRRLALLLVQAGRNVAPAAVSLAGFARENEVPREWVDEVVADLASAKIVMRVAKEERFTLPAGDDPIPVWEIVRAIEGEDPKERLPLSDPVEQSLDEAREALREELNKTAL